VNNEKHHLLMRLVMKTPLGTQITKLTTSNEDIAKRQESLHKSILELSSHIERIDTCLLVDSQIAAELTERLKSLEGLTKEVLELSGHINRIDERMAGDDKTTVRMAERQDNLAKETIELSSHIGRIEERLASDDLTTVKLSERQECLSETIDQIEKRLTNDDLTTLELCKRLDNSDKNLTSLSDQIIHIESRMANDDITTMELADSLKSLLTRLPVIEKKMAILDTHEIFKHPAQESERLSYSQTGEDMILSMVFALLHIPVTQIFYLDLGANHAKELSNTYCFYRQGARGVLVEANPSLIPELKLYRSEDILLNKCITEKSGDTVDFYIMNNDGLSTFVKESAETFIQIDPRLAIEQVIKVETITITDIIQKYFDKAPTLLNIDIEGKEEDILRSIDFTICRPAVIVCEMIPYIPNHLLAALQKNQTIPEIMRQNDYIEYAFTGINSIFIDKKRLP